MPIPATTKYTRPPKVITSISISTAVLAAGKKQAFKQRRSFSAYVEQLILATPSHRTSK